MCERMGKNKRKRMGQREWDRMRGNEREWKKEWERDLCVRERLRENGRMGKRMCV